MTLVLHRDPDVSGQYVTPDGRFRVEYHDDYTRECECQNCQSGATADMVSYGLWIVWDTTANDYAFDGRGGPDGWERKRDAVAWLRQQLEPRP